MVMVIVLAAVIILFQLNSAVFNSPEKKKEYNEQMYPWPYLLSLFVDVLSYLLPLPFLLKF